MAQKLWETYKVIKKGEKKRIYQVTSQIVVPKKTWNVLHNLRLISNYSDKQLKMSTVKKYAAALMKGDQLWNVVRAAEGRNHK